MKDPNATYIRALGEIALRVKDLKAMQEFYQEILGLELLKRSDDFSFFKIADGFGGHTRVLALFRETCPLGYTQG